jgi:hypothetical protein
MEQFVDKNTTELLAGTTQQNAARTKESTGMDGTVPITEAWPGLDPNRPAREPRQARKERTDPFQMVFVFKHE